MNAFDIKPTGLAEIGSQGQGGDQKAAEGGSSAQFMEVLKKARVDVENGTNVMNNGSTVGRLPERTDFQAPREDRPAPRDDAPRERADHAEAPDNRGDDRMEAPRAEHRDDGGHDRHAARDDGRAEAPAENRNDGRGQDQGHDGARRDDGNQQNAQRDSASSQNQGANTDSQGQNQQAATEGQGAAGSAAQTADQASANMATGAIDAVMANQTDNQALAGAAAAAQSAGPAQQANTNGAINSATATTGEAKVEGPIQAQGNIGDQWKSGGQGGEKSQANTQGQQGQGQATANAANQAQGKVDFAMEQGSTAERQAAQLSRMVGEGNRIAVQTQVTDEAATLASKPGSTLSSGTFLATEGGGPAKAPGQPGQPGPLNPNLTVAAQQAAQQGANAGQAQTQQAAAQAAQQVAANSSDAKGPVQPSAQATAPSGNAQTMGGEGQATTNSQGNAQSANQTQQSAKAQAAHQPRFTLPGQAVADQVSVQITKALAQGMDKINIQLKPASLGRVDVQMEMAQDGRIAIAVTADKQETLDLLQKDSRELQKAMQQAGFDMNNGDLSFNLREQQGQGEQFADGRNGGDDLAGASEEEILEAVLAEEHVDIIADDRVDVRA